MKKRRGLDKGYTLIEMAVVMGVMVVMLVITMPRYGGFNRYNALIDSSEQVRQVILEAKSKALAPPKALDDRLFNIIEVKIKRGISTRDAAGNYPLVVQAATITCDGGDSQNGFTLDTLEFPKGITIDSFDPYFDDLNGNGTREAVEPIYDQETTIQFPLAEFRLTCNNRPADYSNFWVGNKKYLSIGIKDNRLEAMRNAPASPKLVHVNIDKYSGQATADWESKSEAGGSVVLPPPAKDYLAEDKTPGSPGYEEYCAGTCYLYDQAQDTDIFTDSGGVRGRDNGLLGLNGSVVQVPIGASQASSWRGAAVLQFRLDKLELPTGKWPRRLKLKLTTADKPASYAGTTLPGFKIYAADQTKLTNNGFWGAITPLNNYLFETAAFSNGAFDSTFTVPAYSGQVQLLAEVATVKPRYQYSVDIDVSKVLARAGSDYVIDNQHPIYLVVAPAGNAVSWAGLGSEPINYFNSDYDRLEKVTDSEGNERFLVPRPYLEVEWW